MKSFYSLVLILAAAVSLNPLAAMAAGDDDFMVGAATGELLVVPGTGLCQLADNKVSEIVGKKSKTVKLALPRAAESVVFSGGSVFAKSGDKVYRCRPTQKLAFTFESDDFRIFPSSRDGCFYAVGRSDSLNIVYLCSQPFHKIEEVVSTREAVILVDDTRGEQVVVTDNGIYRHDDTWQKELTFFEPVRSATVTDAGVVFASENFIALLLATNHIALLAESGCKMLYSYEDKLYVVDEDNSIYEFLIE